MLLGGDELKYILIIKLLHIKILLNSKVCFYVNFKLFFYLNKLLDIGSYIPVMNSCKLE